VTDPRYLDQLVAETPCPLSRKLVEVFRDSARDPAIARLDYVQLLKHEMEAALQESATDAATQSDRS
jgi:hypothetical protein